MVQPRGIEPRSMVLQTIAITKSAKVAYKGGSLTILLLISLIRLSRIGKFILPINHTIVSSQLTPL